MFDLEYHEQAKRLDNYEDTRVRVPWQRFFTDPTKPLSEYKRLTLDPSGKSAECSICGRRCSASVGLARGGYGKILIHQCVTGSGCAI